MAPARSDAAAFERCVLAGGVVVFPSDTVYGLACDPGSHVAVERLYALKGRAADKPAAVMLFSLAAALAALPGLGTRTRAALRALLPGPVTLLLPNPLGRFPLACTSDPGTLGLRVPELPALAGVEVAVLQSSANHAGGPDARRLADVPSSIRDGADLVLDGGTLPGTPSTVIDLRAYEHDGRWTVVRAGALAAAAVGTVLGPPSSGEQRP
jgi:L-threonylcarbamoyladenylate synthase